MNRGINAAALACTAVNSASTSFMPLAKASAPGLLLHYHIHTAVLQKCGTQQ